MQSNASDIIFVAGAPATFRVLGALRSDAGPALYEADIQNILLPLLTPAQMQQLQALNCLDLCLVNEGVGRIRANLHFERGTLAAAIRLLPAEVPTFKSLNLPEQIATLAERRQGLILLTGATGCGKSSTMAALVNQINLSRQDHIITIEDPVEFEHPNRQSLVEQIELGMDTNSFAEAVRSVLSSRSGRHPHRRSSGRRDNGGRDDCGRNGTSRSDVNAHQRCRAEHRTYSRYFPANFQAQVRRQLSLALLAVFIRAAAGREWVDRYPAVEILIATSGIRNLIRRGDDHQFEL